MPFIPEFSTDSIWVGSDVEKCLTDHLDELDTAIVNRALASHTHTGYAASSHTHSNYAAKTHTHSNYAETTHTHNNMIRAINYSMQLPKNTDSSSGSSQVFNNTLDLAMEDGATYLVSIKYTTSAGLVDQSLYSVTYDSSARVVSTFNLVQPKTGSDSLLISQTNGVISIAVSYYTTNTSITTANIRFV